MPEVSDRAASRQAAEIEKAAPVPPRPRRYTLAELLVGTELLFGAEQLPDLYRMLAGSLDGDPSPQRYERGSGSPNAGRSPRGGSEPIRAASEQAYNARVGRCCVCPTTGRPTKYPFEVALPPGLEVHGSVIADQGKPVDRRARKLRKVDVAPQAVLDDVRAKLEVYQGIP